MESTLLRGEKVLLRPEATNLVHCYSQILLFERHLKGEPVEHGVFCG